MISEVVKLIWGCHTGSINPGTHGFAGVQVWFNSSAEFKGAIKAIRNIKINLLMSYNYHSCQFKVINLNIQILISTRETKQKLFHVENTI